MLGKKFICQINGIMNEIIDADVRCNVHAKHMHVVRLCNFIKSTYSFLKRKYEQKNIDEMSKCYIHIQYVDSIIKTLYERNILEQSTIQEYEIYRESVKKTITRDIDAWIDSSFNC